MKNRLSPKTKKKLRLKWDEDNLKKNEVIKKEVIEGMRRKGQKIDEPKTPYQLSPRSDASSSDDEDIRNSVPSKPGGVVVFKKTEFEEEEDVNIEEEEQKMKKTKVFEEKRRKHYDEYRVMKQWREKGLLKPEDGEVE